MGQQHWQRESCEGQLDHLNNISTKEVEVEQHLLTGLVLVENVIDLSLDLVHGRHVVGCDLVVGG